MVAASFAEAGEAETVKSMLGKEHNCKELKNMAKEHKYKKQKNISKTIKRAKGD